MQTEPTLTPFILAPLDESRMISRQRFRRLLGCLLGIGIGLIIGLVSQCINPLLVPGIQLYQPPLGAVLNILLATAIGGALGLTITWPIGSVNGILLGAAVAGLMLGMALFIETQFGGGLGLGGGASLGLLLLPLAGIAVPVTLIFRLAINRAEEARRNPRFAWQTGSGYRSDCSWRQRLIGLTQPAAGCRGGWNCWQPGS
jgi:hypothetical protein